MNDRPCTRRRAGLAEDTALTLTEVTLDRYDQENTYEY